MDGEDALPLDYKEEEEEERLRCEKAFHSLIGVDTANEIHRRLRVSGGRGGGGGTRRGKKKGNNSNNGNKGGSKEKERGEIQVIARGTFIPIAEHAEAEEEEGEEMGGDEEREDDNDDEEETEKETAGARDGEPEEEDVLGTLLQVRYCPKERSSL